MPIISWGHTYMLGIPSIDAEHQKLVQCVNDLFDAVILRKGREVIGGILDELADYTVRHFAHEERVFSQTSYPERAAHQQEHQLLKAKVVDFITDFKAGKRSVNVELMQFLRSWLCGHILKSDKAYVEHFAKNKVP